MTFQVDVMGTAPQTFQSGQPLIFEDPQVWTSLSFNRVEDDAVTEAFNAPMFIRSTAEGRSPKLVRTSDTRFIMPSTVGRHIVQTVLEAGLSCRVLSPQPVRGGFRQAFVTGLAQDDPIRWDRHLFARDPEAIGDGTNLVIGLFFRKFRPQLRTGWMRAYCSNQLLDDRLRLAIPLTSIKEEEKVVTWVKTAIGTGLLAAAGKIQLEPLPTQAIRWAAHLFGQQPEPRRLNSPDIFEIRQGIEDKIGGTATDVLAQEFFEIAQESVPVGVESFVNAVTNLARPRNTWLAGTIGGDPERPILSANTVSRHQEHVMHGLMQTLFLGVQATGCHSHPAIEAAPYVQTERAEVR